MSQIPLSKIVIDESIYPRAAIDETNVIRLMNALAAGAKLPPVTICQNSKRLVDGRHRYEAHKRSNKIQIEVEERAYASEVALFVDAVALNIGHGAQFDQWSLEKAIARLRKFGYTPEKISAVMRVPVAFLGNVFRGEKSGANHRDPTSGAAKPLAVKGYKNYGAHQDKPPRKTAAEKQKPERAAITSKAIFYAKFLKEYIETEDFTDNDNFMNVMSDLIIKWEKICGVEIDDDGMEAMIKNAKTKA